MTVHRSVRPFGPALLSISLLCAGCGRAGASPAIPDPALAAASAAPSTTAVPSATAPPSATATPSIEAPPRESPVAAPSLGEPPAASIAVDGGDPVVGELGSFTWDNSGSDAPWLPGRPIHVGRGERLTLTLADPVDVVNWTVSRAPASAIGSKTVGMAEGSGQPVTFGAPPAGSWSVSVDVWFADNLGSAAYYWLVEVD